MAIALPAVGEGWLRVRTTAAYVPSTNRFKLYSSESYLPVGHEDSAIVVLRFDASGKPEGAPSRLQGPCTMSPRGDEDVGTRWDIDPNRDLLPPRPVKLAGIVADGAATKPLDLEVTYAVPSLGFGGSFGGRIVVAPDHFYLADSSASELRLRDEKLALDQVNTTLVELDKTGHRSNEPVILPGGVGFMSWTGSEILGISGVAGGDLHQFRLTRCP